MPGVVQSSNPDAVILGVPPHLLNSFLLPHYTHSIPQNIPSSGHEVARLRVCKTFRKQSPADPLLKSVFLLVVAALRSIGFLVLVVSRASFWVGRLWSCAFLGAFIVKTLSKVIFSFARDSELLNLFLFLWQRRLLRIICDHIWKVNISRGWIQHLRKCSPHCSTKRENRGKRRISTSPTTEYEH